MWQILIAIVIITYLFFFKKPQDTDNAKKLNAEPLTGPWAWPIIGNSLELFVLVPSTQFLKQLGWFRDRFGTVFKVMFGPQQWILVTNPIDLEKILSSQKFIEKPMDYDLFKPWLLDSLLTSRGDKWRHRRRLLTPSFHFQILDSFMDVFNDQSRILIDKLRRHGPDFIDFEPESSKFALDVLCEAGMGYKLNGLTTDCPYFDANEKIKQITYARYMSPIYKYPVLFRWTKLYKTYYDNIKYVHSMTEKWIEQRKQYWAKLGGIIAQVDPDTGAKRRMAFLDSLLMTRPEIPQDGLLEEITNFAFAGHDTTSTVFAFFIYNLARYQDKQAILFDEIRSVFGDDPNTAITPEQVHQLKYLNLCLKETMRLYPPVPFVGRQVPEDCVIGGKFYPKEAGILCGFYWTHRDPNYFPQPLDFIPERFDKETTREKFNPYTFTPFSAGPRNCIGQKFAEYEIKVTVAHLMRNFVIETDLTQPVTDTRYILVLKPAKGLFVKFKPRVYA